MVDDVLVLDANVLIGFYRANWFSNLAFWRPEYALVTPESIWTDEFAPVYDDYRSPSWLTTIHVTGDLDPPQSGQLSQHDWRALQLARDRNGILVTSDQVLKRRAEEYGLRTKWTGSFLQDTFKQCGITVVEYDDGLDAFLDDAYLPTEACETLRNTQKP